ncbi:MAG: formate dehydrogenase accessory sulfurtransferase FdhD [Clostridia bacterium]|nr:formate dehydrogenase accessory sulfurtransferase FdhD [Clostridia bacterium]
MKIEDLCGRGKATHEQEIVRCDQTGMHRETRIILHETLMHVEINGQLAMKLVCTAEDLSELIVGHLYSEGRISSAEDVTEICISADGKQAQVKTAQPIALYKKPLEIRACNCGEDGVMERATIADADIAPLPDFSWKPEWIYDLARAFREGARLYQLTHGIHSCFLMHEGKILFCCEDIGRHNALDKAIGRALIEGIDLTQCVLFSSGRIPDDMIEKAIRARVPVLASNAVPTDRAVELAREYHVILICTAREKGMDVFSCRELWTASGTAQNDTCTA